MSSQRNSKENHKRGVELPPIPEKVYFTIGEVGKLCCLRPHVLRYWEEEFKQLSPDKRCGKRRYYQHKDILLIRKIRHLLYEQGYTIEGARQQLSNKNTEGTSQKKLVHAVHTTVNELEKMVKELEE